MALDPFTYFLISLAITAVTTTATVLTRKDPKAIFREASPFEDSSIQRAEYGAPVPVLYGTNKFHSLVELYSGDKNSYQNNLNYNGVDQTASIRYLITIVYSIGAGQFDKITKIWFDDKLAWNEDYGEVTSSRLLGARQTINPGQVRLRQETPRGFVNKSELFGDLAGQGAGVYGTIAWRNGSLTNTIQNSNLYSDLRRVASQETGIDESIIDGYIPGYKGISTITLSGFVTHSGFNPVRLVRGFEISEQPYMRRMAVEVQRVPNPLNLSDQGRIIQRYRIPNPNNEALTITYTHIDANPANIIADILTNDFYALEIPMSRLDLPSFRAVGETLRREKSGLSMIIKDFVVAGDLIRQIGDRFDIRLSYDGLRQKYVLNAVRPDSDRGLLEIDTSDIDSIEYSYNNLGISANHFRVTYKDPSQNYKRAVVTQSSQAAISRGEPIRTASLTDESISSHEVASRIATRELEAAQIPLLAARVVLKPGKLKNIKPGQKFFLNFKHVTDQIERAKMICNTTNPGKSDDNRQIIQCIQDPAATNYTIFTQIPRRQSTVPIVTQRIPELNIRLPEELPWFFTNRLIRATISDGINPEESYIRYLGSSFDRQVNAFDTVIEDNDGNFIPDNFGNRITPNGIITDIGTINRIYSNRNDANRSTFTVSNIVNAEAIPRSSYSEFGQKDGRAMLLIEGEYLVYVSLNFLNDNTTIVTGARRGVLDTVRKTINTGRRVWFLFPVQDGETSKRNYEGGENVGMKFLSRTSFGILPENDAGELNFQLQNRSKRPMPLHNLEIDGRRSLAHTTIPSKTSYSVIPRIKPRETMHWEWEGVGTTPETGDRTIYEIFVNSVLVRTLTRLDSDGLTFNITLPSAPTPGSTLAFRCTRWDGDKDDADSFVNWQSYSRIFTVQ